jgi:hypothetical protein
LNQLEPFTLSLSKRRAGLRQAQPERIFKFKDADSIGMPCPHKEQGNAQR